MPPLARAKTGQPSGGQFVARRRGDAPLTLLPPVDHDAVMAAARAELDRTAEAAVAYEVSLRFPDAVRAVFLRDSIMGITVPDKIFNAAGDEMFTCQGDDEKVELARSVRPALKNLSYFGSETFAIEV